MAASQVVATVGDLAVVEFESYVGDTMRTCRSGLQLLDNLSV